MENIDIWEKIRANYRALLTDGDGLTAPSAFHDKNRKRKIEVMERQMEGWLGQELGNFSMDREGVTIFSDLPLTKGEIGFGMMNTVYRLADMARVVKTPGNRYYQNGFIINRLIGAIDFIYQNWYNESLFPYYYPQGLKLCVVPVHAGWSLMEFHIPKGITDFCILLYEEIKDHAGLFENLMSAVDTYAPRCDFSTGSALGANGAAVSWAVMMRAVLMNNIDGKFEKAAAFHAELIRYTNDDNGFHEADGSCLYHGNTAYTLGYGLNFAESCARFLFVLKDTPFDYFSEKRDFMIGIITNSFHSMIYKAHALGMVTGRSFGTYGGGRSMEAGVVISFLNMAVMVYAMLEGKSKIRMGALLKYHLTELVKRNEIQYLEESSFFAYAVLSHILEDPGIVPADQVCDRIFPRMGRAVHFRESYGIGLAMASTRTKAYESGAENKKGWYQGLGTLYTYTSDVSQYDHTYKVAADAMRMPGTTVERGFRFGNGVYNNSDIAGGAAIDGIGMAAAFRYEHVGGSGLTANKSYFVFDQEIICIGSEISSDDKNVVETVADNRMLRTDNGNKILVNGEELKGEWIREGREAWVHAEGNGQGAGMGYYFPGPFTPLFVREKRSGRWEEISDRPGLPKDPESAYFLTMYFDHSSGPKDSAYQYVMLPECSAEQTAQYAKCPPFQIVGCRNGFHGVIQKEKRMMAAVFFEGGTGFDGKISCDSPAGIMLLEKEDCYLAAAADITGKRDGSIRIVLRLPDVADVMGDGVSASIMDGEVVLTVDVSDQTGLTKLTVLKKRPV